MRYKLYEGLKQDEDGTFYHEGMIDGKVVKVPTATMPVMKGWRLSHYWKVMPNGSRMPVREKTGCVAGSCGVCKHSTEFAT